MNRCEWADKSPRLLYYHDIIWGVPIHDKGKLFQKLCLEIFQAGLPWDMIIQKEEVLNRIYHNFDYHYLSQRPVEVFEVAMNAEGGIKNVKKILAVLNNAQKMVDLEELGINVFDDIWEIVSSTPLDHLGKIDDENDLKMFVKKFKDVFDTYGFKRIGNKTLYSFLQAVGIINDHEVHCFKND